jgi:hypothetical protein
MSDLAIYRTFLNEREARALARVLITDSIPCHIQVSRTAELLTWGLKSTEYRTQVSVLVPAAFFEQADKALEAAAQKALGKAVSPPFLKDFTDDELVDVVCTPQEWSASDGVAAQRLLADHGIRVAPELIAARRAATLAASRQGRRANPAVIAGGYLLTLAFGIFGMAIGLFLVLSESRDGEGNSFLRFDATTRKHGWLIIVLGAGAFFVLMAYLLIGLWLR